MEPQTYTVCVSEWGMGNDASSQCMLASFDWCLSYFHLSNRGEHISFYGLLQNTLTEEEGYYFGLDPGLEGKTPYSLQ